jgi:CheY-like chemotaxis protein
MNHFMQACMPKRNEPSGKYGDTSTTYLINKLTAMDAGTGHYEAKIFGGGAVVGNLGMGSGIGDANILMARNILEQFRIPIIEEDVGGKHGRKVYFNTKTFDVEIRSIGARHKDYSDRKIRVLIVDDSALIRKVLRKDIESSSEFEVCGEAGNAYDARDLLLETDPDVISLDIIMPGLDGLDFLEKIMQYRPKPVVIVSTIAKAGSPIAQRAKKLGAVGVIDKEELELYKGIQQARRTYLAALKAAAMSIVGFKGK